MEFILQLLAEWILPEDLATEESFTLQSQSTPQPEAVTESFEETQQSNIFSLVEFH